MGTPTLPGDNGYEEGDGCADCWGVGKTFGDVPTPKYVVATFDEVSPCNGGFAPDGSYTLQQNAINPCTFELLLDNNFWIVWYSSIAGESRLWCRFGPDPAFRAFIGTSDLCDTDFENELVNCVDPKNQAFGGTGVIS